MKINSCCCSSRSSCHWCCVWRCYIASQFSQLASTDCSADNSTYVAQFLLSFFIQEFRKYYFFLCLCLFSFLLASYICSVGMFSFLFCSSYYYYILLLLLLLLTLYLKSEKIYIALQNIYSLICTNLFSLFPAVFHPPFCPYQLFFLVPFLFSPSLFIHIFSGLPCCFLFKSAILYFLFSYHSLLSASPFCSISIQSILFLLFFIF